MSELQRIERIERQLQELLGKHALEPTPGILVAHYDMRIDGNLTIGGSASGRWHYYDAPKTSANWNGQARSTTAKTQIDLVAEFGIPSGRAAVLAKLDIRDSGSAAGSAWMVLSPNSTNYQGLGLQASGKTNDAWETGTFPVPCNASGNIYFQIGASGAGTLDAILEIWGYQDP